MVTTTRKIEEKGQRTPRSLCVYGETGGIKGAANCACGAVFRNKRWYSEDPMAAHEGQKLVCPACRRIAEHNPAGIVSIKGDFFASHEDEIANIVRNTELTAMKKNPLGRTMETIKEKDGITITTTDGKLAEKIGREIYKSHGGELHFLWSQSADLVRVSWSR